MQPLEMDLEYFKIQHERHKHEHFYDPDYVKWDASEMTPEQTTNDFNEIQATGDDVIFDAQASFPIKG